MLAAWLAAAFLLGALPATRAIAHDHPSRPVTVIVPAAPGVTTDFIGRLIADGLSRALNQRFVVENRGEANGDAGNAVGHIEYGNAETLALAASERHPVMTSVPTATQAGVPGFDLTAWFAPCAPAGAPLPVIDRLAAEAERIVQSPEFKAKVEQQGACAAFTGPTELGAPPSASSISGGRCSKGRTSRSSSPRTSQDALPPRRLDLRGVQAEEFAQPLPGAGAHGRPRPAARPGVVRHVGHDAGVQDAADHRVL